MRVAKRPDCDARSPRELGPAQAATRAFAKPGGELVLRSVLHRPHVAQDACEPPAEGRLRLTERLHMVGGVAESHNLTWTERERFFSKYDGEALGVVGYRLRFARPVVDIALRDGHSLNESHNESSDTADDEWDVTLPYRWQYQSLRLACSLLWPL